MNEHDKMHKLLDGRWKKKVDEEITISCDGKERVGMSTMGMDINKYLEEGKKKMNKRILNVGSGRDKYGTDFIDIYPNRNEVVKCDVSKDKFPYKDETFEEVYSKNLFEHIIDLTHLLNEMKRVLKKGGKLRIITDNAGFFLFHIPIRKNNFLQHNSNSVRGGKEDRHYFLFTPLHLKNHLEKLGGFNKFIIGYDYKSQREMVKFFRPIFKILNKTFLVRLINPHLVLEGYKNE